MYWYSAGGIYALERIAVALHDELGHVPKQDEDRAGPPADPGDVPGRAGAALPTKGAAADRPVGDLLTSEVPSAKTPMLIGYARVSTTDQTLALQQGALKRAGCERIFTDAASGSRTDRTGLEEALRFLRDGEDTLVVWRLDRLGRSLRHLIDTISELQERGVGFRSLQEQIDTTTSGGKLVFHVFGALAEFERDLIRERTQAGLAAARARGRLGGRPRALDERKAQIARVLYADKSNSIADICRTLGISRATLYRYVGGTSN